jgi:small-conductance mechanosensitive channel
MQDQAEFRSLPFDLAADLQDARILWQLGALAACLLAAWLTARLARARWTAVRRAPEETLRLTLGGVNRLIFPVTALLLALVVRWLLKREQPVHLLDVGVALLFSFALVQLAGYILRHAFAPSGVLRYWERSVAWLIWIGVALHVTGMLDELRALLDGLRLQVGKQSVSVLEILSGALSVAITVVVALWMARMVEGRLEGAQGLDPGLRAVLSKLAKTVLVVLAVLVALPLVGMDLTVLSVFGGALGVGIGFGLQKIAANYISGFIILLDRSIRPGDLIAIGDRAGAVTRLTARYIVVRSVDGTEALIPNETVVSSTVVNHSYSDNIERVAVPIQVSYASDMERALHLMEQAAWQHPRVLKKPEPLAMVAAFADSGINLELYAWIADPESGKGNLRSDLYRVLWKSFKENGIEIPFPQREVRILSSGTPAAAPPVEQIRSGP